MSEKPFTAGEVTTGLCLWEAWLDLIKCIESVNDNVLWDDKTTAAKAATIQENAGTWDCRGMMVGAIRDCDKAWTVANGLEANGFDGSFDWDFVPAWLAGAIESGRFD